MDDDFDAEDAALIGGFLGLVEEEEELEKKRKKIEKEALGLDDADGEHDDEEEI
jgi:hypothetical protein